VLEEVFVGLGWLAGS